MIQRLRPTTLLLAGLTTAGLALSACGSNSLDTGSSSSSSSSSGSSSSTTTSVDSALAAKVPQKIKDKGTIVVGSDASYAPNEFIDPDGKTVVGMDVDLFKAVAAKLGLKADFQNAGFDTIILGVTSGKYDVGVSSFTINPDRKKQVNMVSYFNAGTQWAVKKGNPKKVDPNNACGLPIGVQKGTTQIDDLTARSKKCTDAGKPAIKQIIDADQSKVTASVISGKSDAMLADSPVGLYAVKQTGGQLEALGDIYDSAPYGIVVPKAETDFAQAIADAFKAIAADGTYKATLTKWGNDSGAISDFAVNP
ncbi:ABC transporter substrate-binding protein [Pedococcus sp. 5OH_020]|uniref:ABC transporter substrate-binding protein n=1 Tax=Pedococcus sp. 5OH_020 TaxID=2989814 RepID=UPI0022E9C3E6|nr:ABC transporter substrate-binding protein [Pedococcus sp. 5OH_020]